MLCNIEAIARNDTSAVAKCFKRAQPKGMASNETKTQVTQKCSQIKSLWRIKQAKYLVMSGTGRGAMQQATANGRGGVKKERRKIPACCVFSPQQLQDSRSQDRKLCGVNNTAI